MPRSGEAAEPVLEVLEVLAEAFISQRADGRSAPTLSIETRTQSASLRQGRAMALWGAAYAELMLEKRGECLWVVSDPRRAGHGPVAVEDGWRSKWEIHLEGPQGADAELAMLALGEVVEILRDLFGTRHPFKGPEWN